MIENVFKDIFLKILNRPKDSYKYSFGHVLIIGGSSGMIGAPLLVGRASLRTGAGLVTIASTTNVTNKLERRVEELMTLTLNVSAPVAFKTLNKFIKDRNVSVLVIGPGLKPQPEALKLLKLILKSISLPIIIDAGALSKLGFSPTLIKNTVSKDIILTPHLGEFQKLVVSKLPNNRPDLKPIAVQFAKTHSVTLVLKGHPTYVTHPNGSIYTNKTGNPGLAKAGTGDVLTGIIAGLISQHVESEVAAEAGVYLHGLAGDIAAKIKTEPGMLASDVIEAIPTALKATTKT